MTKIGIIGTGWGARVQVPAFRDAGLDVIGTAGAHRNKTHRVAGERQVTAFDDWRELVASNDVDLISIVTPPAEHLPMALAALEANKHVLSEKPTALNTHEAEQLVAAAKAHPDRLALIDHEMRFLPAWRSARERLRDLGDIRYIEARYASPSRGDRKREWNGWSA